MNMDNSTPDSFPDQGTQPPRTESTPSTAAPFVSAPKTNTLAIVSFVSSFFIGLVAIITGHIALGQIRARGEIGRGFALAGLIIGYVGTAIVAILVVFSLVFASAIWAVIMAAGSVSSSAGTSTPSASTAPLPTGVLGAANFDEGYLEFGTGGVIVDEYVDPMCPFCAQFEEANGELLLAGVESGVITLRVHSLTFLDRYSEGTNYSSRASAALTCQATLNPDRTLELVAALFANQPRENTAGLSNQKLSDLVQGTESIIGCVDSGDYESWSQHNTEAALTGPIEGAEIPSVSGTPTVLVNGALYTGSLTDTAAFSAFVAAAF